MTDQTEALTPQQIDALLGEAMGLHQAGRLPEAAPLYRRILEAQPDHAQANNLFGLVCLQSGDNAGAIAHMTRATQLEPDNPQYHCNLGVALDANALCEKAVLSLNRAIELKPDYAEAYSNRGMALNRAGAAAEAVASHRQAIALRPGEGGFHLNLANALAALGDVHEAEAAYRKALELRPGHAGALEGLSRTLVQLGRADEAVATAQSALARRPKVASYHRTLGGAHRRAGRTAEAVKCYRAALEIDPSYADAWMPLAQLVRKEARDAEYDELLRRCADAGLDDDARAKLGFAAAAWTADLGDHEGALGWYERANQARRLAQPYSQAAAEDDFRIIRSDFDPMPETPPASGAPADAPIFIVGLPRAGKTTLEGMLARHPGLWSAGELRVLPLLSRDLSIRHGLARPGGHIGGVPAEELAALGRDYMDYVRGIAPAGSTSIDTMPPNFRLIGLIRLALPNARVIHCVRDPLDHCIAIFEKHFGQPGYGYGDDLRDLAAYYRLYRGMMAYWHEAMPGFILDVDIAGLAAAPEEGMRRVLAHCRLDWHAECAGFHQSEPRMGESPASAAAAREARRAVYRPRLAPLLEGYLG